MFIGACREITYRGQPAFLFVLRNNGECWGRLITAGSEELDVTASRDCYECNDDVALSAFARAVTRGRVEQAAGWLGFHRDNRLLPKARR